MKNNYRFLLLITLIIPFCGLALQSDPLMKRISTHRTDTRIRLFITYLDSIQLQEKTSRNLEPLFVGLKKLDDQRLNRYIEYNNLSSEEHFNKDKSVVILNKTSNAKDKI